MIENIINLNKDEIAQNVKNSFNSGLRFITITCVEILDGFEIIYSFAKKYEMNHFKISISKDEEIESISSIYFSAMLVENELKDLFGIKVNNLAIDYDGKLLLSEGAPYAPMCSNDQIQIEVKGETKNGE